MLKIGHDLKYDLADFRAARHRARALRRHHADVLRARCRTLQPRARCSWRSATSITPRSMPTRSSGSGKSRITLRLRPDRQGGGIRRRGGRHGVAAVAACSSRGWPPSTWRRSTRRWSARWCRCSRAWSGAASRSTGRCCRACPANSRSAPPRSKPRSQSWPASPLQSRQPEAARRHPVRQVRACPAAPRPRPANGRPARACSTTWPSRAIALPQKILDWRQVSKLKSTYTDALPGYVNPDTHRVHTSYALAATPTGRLSSSEPNLQNIPIRTEEGRKIRRAFIATDRPQAGLRRLFADRAAAAGRDRRHRAAARRRSATASTSTP